MPKIIKFQKGSLFLPLLLLLSLSGLFLVKAVTIKSFTGYQSEVTGAIDDRYDSRLTKYTLSEFIGPINTWDTYTDKNYGYSIKYPKVWVNTLQTENPKGSTLAIFEAALGEKIKLQVNVKKSFDISKYSNKIKVGSKDFYLHENTALKKAAVTQHKKLYYEIILNDKNYFTDQLEFQGAFSQILKNFEFVN